MNRPYQLHTILEDAARHLAKRGQDSSPSFHYMRSKKLLTQAIVVMEASGFPFVPAAKLLLEQFDLFGTFRKCGREVYKYKLNEMDASFAWLLEKAEIWLGDEMSLQERMPKAPLDFGKPLGMVPVGDKTPEDKGATASDSTGDELRKLGFI